MAKSNKKELSPIQQEGLLKIVKARFEKNMPRHKGIEWNNTKVKLYLDQFCRLVFFVYFWSK